LYWRKRGECLLRCWLRCVDVYELHQRSREQVRRLRLPTGSPAPRGGRTRARLRRQQATCQDHRFAPATGIAAVRQQDRELPAAMRH
jgi:hypothetical protein